MAANGHHLFEKVTLNCDMGESYGLYKMGDDNSMLDVIDVANVACGFHASDFMVMADTVKKANARGVQVGAHPSFPDLQGFGRRQMALTPEEVKHSVLYQVGALKAFLESENLELSHIKPHGSLYGVAMRDEKVCSAILDVCELYDVPLIGIAGTFQESLAKERGVPFLAEFFPDLDYDDNGRIIITRSHQAVDPETAAERVQKALVGKYYSVNGKEFEIHPQTICVHSDTPGAVEIAQAVRRTVDTFNMLGAHRDVGGLKTVLVANRGEIACRVIRTCKKMGIKTIAIYETCEENAMHALEADDSVELPKGETYVSIDTIVKICQQSNVDAVHPGYGFLSENPSFCEAVEKIGVTFLGPTTETIMNFGLKHKAREVASTARVPIVPGSDLLGGIDAAVEEASKLTYPVLLKATGGGGGIGMQVCQDEQQLQKAFVSCQRTAEKYFGNSGVYLEKYYPESRHIEVQVFGDGLGQVIHLGERECSVQRRHQKVIEETPSPFLIEKSELRQEICEAAVRLTRSVNYRSAGTVEFLVVDEGTESSETGKFFFLEMNTRLQVEHGITELTNGVDLVEWMILLGGKQNHSALNLDRFRWNPSGHAIEVRIYAENPSLNFQPSPGLLTEVAWPSLQNVRVDTWVKSGSKVTTAYDPLLAKIMAYGKDRDAAIGQLLGALSETTVAGPVTNLDFLSSVIQHDDFKSGHTTTQILKRVTYTPQAIRVLQGGPDTTLQDWPGRIGLRVYGIQTNGPIDDLAFRVANILVGNDQGVAGLEMAMRGPKLYFYVTTLVAITGADMQVTLSTPDMKTITKSTWSRFYVPAGSTLSIGNVCKGSVGCRSYLAVLGGIQVPDYLGSKSTFSVFGYGGFQGRALQANDMLSLARSIDVINRREDIEKDLLLPEMLRPTYSRKWEIECMPGPHADPDYVTPAGMDEFFSVSWEVHFNSAKMGVRLKGPTPQWARKDGGDGGSHPSNIHDTGYGMGSINFTGDSPVILTCDAPTQGGFTCPWSVVSGALWKTGQVGPGDTIHFCPISIDDALDIRSSQEEYLSNVKQIAMFPHMPVPIRSFPFLTPTPSADVAAVSNLHYNRAILKELSPNPSSNQPNIQYRQSGDCYILIEYGDPIGSVDLNIFARARLMQQTLRLHTDTLTQKVENPLIPGTLDCAPSIRSLLIRYDAKVIPQATLVSYLEKLEVDLPDVKQVVFPSRDIRMPFVFDDHWSQEAADQYRQSIRPEASYLPSNVEFIAQNNGLTGGKQEIAKHYVDTPFLTLGVGFFLGCPLLCQINPLDRLKVPKYNPSRLYTPAGTVGVGGSLTAIYPLESPGGYQMCGRTIPTWDTFGSVSPFAPHQPWLLNIFDKVTFYKVSESELLQYRRLAIAGKHKYEISDSTFDMVEYNKLAQGVAKERKQRDEIHKVASAKFKAIEEELLLKQAKAAAQLAPETTHEGVPEGQQVCEALIAGIIKDVQVKVGDRVTAGETVLCILEAMKTEMEVIADVNGVVVKVLGVPGQQVSAIDVVCILET
jgi:urea carboxylase